MTILRIYKGNKSKQVYSVDLKGWIQDGWSTSRPVVQDGPPPETPNPPPPEGGKKSSRGRKKPISDEPTQVEDAS